MTYTQPRPIPDTAPTVFRLKVPISQAEMALLRRHFLPGESATQAIRRLALDRVREEA
jgi:hypothetical protein